MRDSLKSIYASSEHVNSILIHGMRDLFEFLFNRKVGNNKANKLFFPEKARMYMFEELPTLAT